MTVTAAHIESRRGQVEGLVIGRFHAAHEGAEIRQVTEVKVEEIFFRHGIMIALS
jgi:hypothetical protein